MHVEFTGNAQVRGVGFRRGDVAELDDETGRAYIAAGQAREAKLDRSVAAVIESQDDDEDEPGKSEPSDDAATETTERAGKPVRTATRKGGTRR